jgi:hypothetical protein
MIGDHELNSILCAREPGRAKSNDTEVQLTEAGKFFFFFNCHIIVVLRIHCDVYKRSYNIS